MAEEEKMKMRYMRERRDQLQGKSVVINKRKSKFNLDGDSDGEEELNFLTHKGRRLDIDKIDDFKDKISNSDNDNYSDDEMRKGIMGQEMVDSFHFGGGPERVNENMKKTREERHAEIM